MTVPVRGKTLVLSDFPHVRTESIRYCDTDRQGHVNNAVFATFFECSRTRILYDPQRQLVRPESEWVIVKLEIEFMAEINWPGSVDIGTRVKKTGRSSVVMEQVIFQEGVLTARSENIMVLIDSNSRRSIPLLESVLKGVSDLVVGAETEKILDAAHN